MNSVCPRLFQLPCWKWRSSPPAGRCAVPPEGKFPPRVGVRKISLQKRLSLDLGENFGEKESTAGEVGAFPILRALGQDRQPNIVLTCDTRST